MGRRQLHAGSPADSTFDGDADAVAAIWVCFFPTSLLFFFSSGFEAMSFFFFNLVSFPFFSFSLLFSYFFFHFSPIPPHSCFSNFPFSSCPLPSSLSSPSHLLPFSLPAPFPSLSSGGHLVGVADANREGSGNRCVGPLRTLRRRFLGE